MTTLPLWGKVKKNLMRACEVEKDEAAEEEEPLVTFRYLQLDQNVISTLN